MISVDFHTHTSASKDSLTSPRTSSGLPIATNWIGFVVTDHNNIFGALAAYALDPELIIVGEEIMTTCGEILAAFVTAEVPAGLSPWETIQRLRDQGAFISVSHPFDFFRNGAWKMEDLLEIAPLVDAVEIFNARCMAPQANQKAAVFTQKQGIPGTAGSDAHAAFELGAARLLLPQFFGTG